MRNILHNELTRRTLLKLGVTSATLAAIPWAVTKEARATEANPHLLITFHGDGGWDPTQVLDYHDPLDSTDGVDVDHPAQVALGNVSAFRQVGAVYYQSNPGNRPMVDTFFDTWVPQVPIAIVNGIGTRSTSHDQSTQLVHTGYLDPTRADFSVMAAHHNGRELPLPHLQLSGPAFGGPFAGLSGRVGGQLSEVLAYNRIRIDPGQTRQLGVSALGEAYVQQALEQQRVLDASGAVAGKLASFYDAQSRGDKLARAASSLPNNSNNGAVLAAALGDAFRQGLTTSVTISNQGGFDTHGDNQDQLTPWNNIFTFLNTFVQALSTQPGIQSPSLLAETTIVYCSDFGRTPLLNGNLGKDHHPFTSILFIGRKVKPGVYGQTDRDQEGVPTNFSTGLPDSVSGTVIDVTNMVAGIVTLVGGNASEYMPGGVKPFTAMIA
jgi:uncharacterized protein (DUF1501 family)